VTGVGVLVEAPIISPVKMSLLDQAIMRRSRRSHQNRDSHHKNRKVCETSLIPNKRAKLSEPYFISDMMR
jgi:hypothetical protein